MSIWTTIPARYIPPPALPVLVVGNLKGGVGKTSVVAYLAYALAHIGYRVLVIDFDFQASLSAAMVEGLTNPQTDGAVNVLLADNEHVFSDARVVCGGYGHWTNITLVRTSFELSDVEDRLFAGFVLNKVDDARFMLAKKLASPTLRNDFDVVLIDTPPRLTVAAVNAICASTHILIPTAPTFMGINGATNFVETLKKLHKSLSLHFQIMSVLPTLGISSTLNQWEVGLLNELEREIKPIAIWRDLHIWRKPDIAANRGFNYASIRDPFTLLAERISMHMGLTRNGGNSNLGAARNARSSGNGIPQSRQ